MSLPFRPQPPSSRMLGILLPLSAGLLSLQQQTSRLVSMTERRCASCNCLTFATADSVTMQDVILETVSTGASIDQEPVDCQVNQQENPTERIYFGRLRRWRDCLRRKWDRGFQRVDEWKWMRYGAQYMVELYHEFYLVSLTITWLGCVVLIPADGFRRMYVYTCLRFHVAVKVRQFQETPAVSALSFAVQRNGRTLARVSATNSCATSTLFSLGVFDLCLQSNDSTPPPTQGMALFSQVQLEHAFPLQISRR